MAAPKKKPLAELEREVERLLEAPLGDAELLGALEKLAAEDRRLGILSYRYGPVLYRRNRAHFRPFLRAHFLTSMWDPPKLHQVKYQDNAKALDAWLSAVDEADDLELFPVLFTFKHGYRPEAFQAELKKQYDRAATSAARALVLQKFERLYFLLDEETALFLYQRDPLCRDFILARLPYSSWGIKAPARWKALSDLAERAKDDALYFALYRRQIDAKTWEADALALIADPKLNPAALDEALRQRHPDLRPPLGRVLLALLEARGRDGLGYFAAHLAGLLSGGGEAKKHYTKLIELAEARGWLDVWALIIRRGGQAKEFDEAVAALLKDDRADPGRLRERLQILAGVSAEWSYARFGVAVVFPLSDATATLFFQRFPDILRQVYRVHLGNYWMPYPELVSALVAARDDELLDHLASRFITRPLSPAHKEVSATVDLLSYYYEGLKQSPEEFAWRASQVLTRIPAYSIGNYNALVSTNRLARLLFERSRLAYLSAPEALRDLLESAEIHAQLLGFRVLSADDARAAALAAENIDLLLPTLLRALHRQTRVPALKALGRAAIDEVRGALILRRAREAYALPDRKYPKEELLSLIAGILRRHPALRAPGEAPRVFRREGASS